MHTWRDCVLLPYFCFFVGAGLEDLFRFWGEGVRISGLAGVPARLRARRLKVSPSGRRAAGTFPAPNLRFSDVGVSPLAGHTSQTSCPRSRGTWSRGPAGWMLRRACWQQLREIDPCALPGSVASAAARGSIESSSLRGRAARRALGKYGVCLRWGTGAGRPRRAGCVSPGASPLGPLPQLLGLRGSRVRGTQSVEGIPPLPITRSQAWQALGVWTTRFGRYCSVGASVSPSEE